MRAVDNIDFAGAGRTSEATQRYNQIAESKVGKTFLIEKGVDFKADEDVEKVRMRYVSSLRTRGVKVNTKIEDGDLYIRVSEKIG